MRPVATAAGPAAAVLLGACGVGSTTTLFAARDASAQRLREGTWAIAGAGCELGAAPTLASLPDCAVTVRIAGDRLTPTGRLAEGDGPKPATILLVENRPLLLQMVGQADPNAVKYFGVRSSASDPAGRITRGVGWVLSCPGAKVVDSCSVHVPAEVRARAGHASPLQSAFVTWIAP